MIKRAIMMGLFLVVLTLSGCVGTTQTPEPLYVCPNGETVTAPDLCPKPTTAPPTTTQITPSPPTAPPSTAPPTSPPTTESTTTTSTTSSTTTSSPEPRPVLEIIEETISEGPSGEFWLEGKIRNNGDVDLFFVQV